MDRVTLERNERGAKIVVLLATLRQCEAAQATLDRERVDRAELVQTECAAFQARCTGLVNASYERQRRSERAAEKVQAEINAAREKRGPSPARSGPAPSESQT